MDYSLSEQQLDWDYIVLGTDLPQQLFAAHLAKLHKASVLNLDVTKYYNSELRTLNLKQFRSLLDQKEERSECREQVYQRMNLKEHEKSLAFLDQLIEKGQFRGYNIQMQPKLIFGKSVVTSLLQEADIDRYTDFRNIKEVYLLDLQLLSEHKVPFSKADILKSQYLSLKEKKELFQALQVVFAVDKFINRTSSDVNSLNQFSKEAKVDPVWLQLYDSQKNNPCFVFIKKLCPSPKILNIFYYVLAGFMDQLLTRPPSTLDFVSRVARFLDSCGAYGKTPYLIMQYGAADVAQAFSRIASVFGTTYILHPKLQIKAQVQKDFVILNTNLNQKGLKAKRVIANSGFRLFAQSPLDNQNFFIILLGNSQAREERPALIHILPLEGRSRPAILYEWGCSLGSPIQVRYIRSSGSQQQAQYLVDQIVQFYKIQLKVCVGFRRKYFKGSQSGIISMVNSNASISLDEDFSFFQDHKLASAIEGKYFRLPEEFKAQQKQEQTEMLKILQQLELQRKQQKIT